MKDETLLPNDLIHMAISAIEDLLDHCDPSTDHYCGVWADVPDKLRAALQSGNSAQPVTVPAGYALVPVDLTVEMRKAFHQANDEAERFVSPDHQWQAMLAAAPKAPDGWIPVSERMPLTPSADCEYSDIEVSVFDGEHVFTAHYAVGSLPQPWGDWVDTYANITHWQPLPDAPKGV